MSQPPSGRSAPRSASSEILPAEAAREFLDGLKRPCRLLVAYSGGGDSTGLLAAFAAEAQADPDVSLVAATVDHGLRPGSTEEAHAAGVLCASLSISHHVLTWQGDKPKSGIQAAARDARYRLLGDLARDIGAGLMVTAHTSDDQDETVAMRQMRNPEAEAGISEAVLYDRHIWIFRPFLGVKRVEIRDYLTERGIGWVDDPSNDNEVFERVRVRKALAHVSRYGKREAPPGRVADEETGLGPLWKGVGEEASLSVDLGEAAARFLLANVTLHSALVATVDLAGYSPENPAHLAAIRHLAAMMGGRMHPGGRATAERIGQFLAGSDAARLTAERVVFDRRRQHLYLTRERRSLPEAEIGPGCALVWDHRFRISNHGDTPVRVGARGDVEGEALLSTALSAKLPAGIRQRALTAEPMVLSGPLAKLRVEPVIAQFDRFLPLRQLPIANALAFLIGLDHFPGLPTR